MIYEIDWKSLCSNFPLEKAGTHPGTDILVMKSMEGI